MCKISDLHFSCKYEFYTLLTTVIFSGGKINEERIKTLTNKYITMSEINKICVRNCKNKPIRGAGILNVFRFCCENGLNKIREDIREKYNLKWKTPIGL